MKKRVRDELKDIAKDLLYYGYGFEYFYKEYSSTTYGKNEYLKIWEQAVEEMETL